MKKTIAVLGLFMLGTLLFSQVNLPAEHQFVSGNWVMIGNRLYQNDAGSRLAKINIAVPQEDIMIYEFDARYEGGAEDGHGGFGLHLLIIHIREFPGEPVRRIFCGLIMTKIRKTKKFPPD